VLNRLKIKQPELTLNRLKIKQPKLTLNRLKIKQPELTLNRLKIKQKSHRESFAQKSWDKRETEHGQSNCGVKSYH